MFRGSIRALAAIALTAVAVVAAVVVAWPVQAASTAKGSKTQPPTSVRFIDAPSSESPAARKKRLQKECKGRPNAGACLGLTR